MFGKAVEFGAKEVVAVANGHARSRDRIADPFGHHGEICHPLDEEHRE